MTRLFLKKNTIFAAENRECKYFFQKRIANIYCMLILNALFFVPCFVCVWWAIIFCFKQKTLAQRLLLWLVLFCTYYHLSYALYVSPWTDYLLMVHFDVLNMPVSFIILALDLLYIRTRERESVYYSKTRNLLFLPALFFLIVGTALSLHIGLGRIANFEQMLDEQAAIPAEFQAFNFLVYRFFTEHFFHFSAFVAILSIVYHSGDVARRQGYKWGDAYRFFFRGAVTTPTRALCLMNAVTAFSMVPISIVGRSWMINHPAVAAICSLLTAFFVHLLCYVEYISDIKHCTLYRMSHLNLVTDMVDYKSPEKKEDQAVVPVAVAPSVATPSEMAPDSIADRVRQAFEVERVYRDPELSINSLADYLGTNRTTLSLSINQLFGMNFRLLLSSYRVEAAKQFMLEHPNANQDAIAVECGFSSAQAFNLKFKVITGKAPRSWLMENVNQ